MSALTSALAQQHCSARQVALSDDEAAQLLTLVPGWSVQHGKLCRTFKFSDFHRTMAFVDALAAMIHQQDHHPEPTITYQQCTLRYDTHSVNGGRGGLSDNDFICAARADVIAQSTIEPSTIEQSTTEQSGMGAA